MANGGTGRYLTVQRTMLTPGLGIKMNLSLLAIGQIPAPKVFSKNKCTLTRLDSNKAVLHYDDGEAEGTVNKETLLA